MKVRKNDAHASGGDFMEIEIKGSIKRMMIPVAKIEFTGEVSVKGESLLPNIKEHVKEKIRASLTGMDFTGTASFDNTTEQINERSVKSASNSSIGFS